MNSKKITETKIVLELTQDEADWLHLVMQNPHFDCTPQNEQPQDKKFRKLFYEATR